MFKRIILIMLAFILISPAILTARDDSEIPIISVLDFTINNISEGDMQSIITLLSSALFRTGSFTVIDVSQRAAILAEMEFSNSGCSDESCQLEIGKLLSAEMIVVGDIAKVGSRYLMTAKLLETETGKTLLTADGVYGSLDELIDDLFPVAERLASDGEEPQPSGDAVAAGGTAEETVSDTGKIEGRSMSPRKIAAWSTMAAGVIVSGLGGYFIYDAVQFNNDEVIPSYEAHENADQGSDFEALWDAYQDNYDEFKSKTILAGAVTGGGVLLLGASVWLFLMPEKVTDNVAAVFYTDPVNNTATLSFNVRY